MKRTLSLFVVLVLVWLAWWFNRENPSPVAEETAPPIKTPVKTLPAVPLPRKVELVPTEKNDSKPPGTEPSHAANVDSELSGAEPPPSASHSDMSGHVEELFSIHRKDLGSTGTEVEGKVTISYRGYEGKFKVHFLIPPVSGEAGTYVVIYMADEKNPTVNTLGGTSVKFPETAGGLCQVDFGGHSIHPFFKKKEGAELSPGQEPTSITRVLFHFDPRKRKGTSQAEVLFSNETKGPATPIGRFDYVTKPTTPPGS